MFICVSSNIQTYYSLTGNREREIRIYFNFFLKVSIKYVGLITSKELLKMLEFPLESGVTFFLIRTERKKNNL